jgi:phosphoenolpyruvate---glycerone phosphotransferase subunit DhaM
MVSLVLVAHSARLLAALAELIDKTTSAMPPCFIAGGTDDGRMGTSLGRVRAALRAALDASEEGCLVLYDSGSAWLTIGIAVDDLTEPDRSRVLLSDAALVEGALAAAARAGDGAPLPEVAAAAAGALEGDKRPAITDPERDAGVRLTA